MSVATSDMGLGSRSGLIRNAILIAGPTASGKSALALDLAEHLGGAIVNTDSMQGYTILNVLTARPDDAALSLAPHLLYGHVDPASQWSTGAWLRAVGELSRAGLFERQRPIFVGGTGLYFRALTHGLAEMPPIPDSVRAAWRQKLVELGAARLHGDLARIDPSAAAGIRPTDGQRIVRALEVTEVAGMPFSALKDSASEPVIDVATSRGVVLDPARAELRARIDHRIGEMVEHQVLEEVRDMISRRLDPASPALKAIGLREFADHLAGVTTLQDAMAATATATRQYAKRQATWFRRQVPEQWPRVASVQEATALLD